MPVCLDRILCQVGTQAASGSRLPTPVSAVSADNSSGHSDSDASFSAQLRSGSIFNAFTASMFSCARSRSNRALGALPLMVLSYSDCAICPALSPTSMGDAVSRVFTFLRSYALPAEIQKGQFLAESPRIYSSISCEPAVVTQRKLGKPRSPFSLLFLLIVLSLSNSYEITCNLTSAYFILVFMHLSHLLLLRMFDTEQTVPSLASPPPAAK